MLWSAACPLPTVSYGDYRGHDFLLHAAPSTLVGRSHVHTYTSKAFIFILVVNLPRSDGETARIYIATVLIFLSIF